MIDDDGTIKEEQKQAQRHKSLQGPMHHCSFCSATVVCTGHTLKETQLSKFRHSAVHMSRVRT